MAARKRNRVQIPIIVEAFFEGEVEGKKVTGGKAATPVNKAKVRIERRDNKNFKVWSSESGAGTITEGERPEVETNEFGVIPGWLEEGPYTLVASGGTPAIAATTFNWDAVSGRGVENVGESNNEVEGSGVVTTKDLVAAVREALVPVGTLLAYAGESPPEGYFLCNGEEQSTASYPNLFAVCGSKYGTGAAGKFVLPDLRGRSPMGAGTGPGLSARSAGQKLGSQEVTLTKEQMPVHSHTGVTGAANTSIESGNHTHNIFDGGHAHGGPDGGILFWQTSPFEGAYAFGAAPAYAVGSQGIGGLLSNHGTGTAGAFTGITGTEIQNSNHTHVAGPLSISNDGSGEGHANIHPASVVGYIIKHD